MHTLIWFKTFWNRSAFVARFCLGFFSGCFNFFTRLRIALTFACLNLPWACIICKILELRVPQRLEPLSIPKWEFFLSYLIVYLRFYVGFCFARLLPNFLRIFHCVKSVYRLLTMIYQINYNEFLCQFYENKADSPSFDQSVRYVLYSTTHVSVQCGMTDTRFVIVALKCHSFIRQSEMCGYDTIFKLAGIQWKMNGNE